MRGQVRNLVGKTDWNALIQEVSSLDLLLTPDTGTMHLAASLGVPVLAFSSPRPGAMKQGPMAVDMKFCRPPCPAPRAWKQRPAPMLWPARNSLLTAQCFAIFLEIRQDPCQTGLP